MGAEACKTEKFQIAAVQDTADKALRQVRHEQHAQITLLSGHLLDDAAHIRFLQAHLDAGLIEQVEKLHEGLGAEGITLGADGKPGAVFHPALAVIILDLSGALHQRCHLRQQLPAVLRQRDAPVAAVENSDPQLLFQFPDGCGHGGLGHKEILRSLVHGAAAVDLHQIVHLQQGHAFPPRFV